jgi:hypothetical protein
MLSARDFPFLAWELLDAGRCSSLNDRFPARASEPTSAVALGAKNGDLLECARSFRPANGFKLTGANPHGTKYKSSDAASCGFASGAAA